MKLFSSKKIKSPLNRNLQQVDLADLRKERITLDNEERRLQKQNASVQQQRLRVLQEYHTAREQGADHQAKIIARQLKNIDDQLRGFDLRHDTLNKQQRMVNGLMVLKENESFITRIAGNSRLNQMNLVELQNWVEQATEKGDLTTERLEQMIGTMDSNFDTSHAQPDVNLDDYMANLDKEMPVNIGRDGRSTGLTDDALDASLAKLEDKMSRYQGL